MKKTLLVLLAVLLLAGLFAVCSSAATVVESGSCGSNVTYTLDSDGLLTISGTGNMENWGRYSDDQGFQNNVPWGGSDWFGYDDLLSLQRLQRIKRVVIENGVTSIGDSAFLDCTSLISVTIPDSVTSIGSRAFSLCTELPSVTIPDSVTSIGEIAFHSCTGLTSVTIGNGLTSIERYAFGECTGLTSVTIPDSVTSIGDYTFYNCWNLTSVMIPDSVTSIGYWPFELCTKLSDIYYNGTALEWNQIEIISADTYLTGAALHLRVDGGSCGDNLTWILYDDGLLSIRGTGEMNNYIDDDDYSFTDAPWSGSITNTQRVKNVVIQNGVTSIGVCAFYGCSKLTTLTIPDSVTSIGGSAFDSCTGLTSVMIPDSVTSIGDDAFYNCKKLTMVTIGSGVTSIGGDAFYNCIGLTRVNINDLAAWCNILFEDYYSTPLYYAEYFYLNGTEITDLVIPDGVTSIGSYAFDSFKNMISVTIPDSVTSIGNWAFENCTGLTRVNINDLTAWCNIPFDNGYNNNPLTYAGHLYLNGTEITDLVIPDSVTSIVANAFSQCSGLTSVTIPDSVTSIGDYAFQDCVGLTTVTIGNSVTSIGFCAFENCTGLTDVYFNGTQAQWNAISIESDNSKLTKAARHYLKFTISFDANGGGGAPAAQVKTVDKALILSNAIPSVSKQFSITYNANGGTAAKASDTFVYTFTAWNTAADDSGTAYQPGGSFTVNADTTLYAQWEAPAIGELPTAERAGYTFDGWYTAAEGGSKVEAGTVIAADTTLYAHWTGNLADCTVTLSAASFTYNAAVQQPAVTVTNAVGAALTEGVHYIVAYSNESKTVGTYSVVVIGVNNFSGTVQKSYKIVRLPITANNMMLSADSLIYNGAVQQPAVSVRAADGSAIPLDGSSTVAWSAASKYPGTYTVTVTGKGNFSGTATKEYKIAKQPLDAARVTLYDTEFTYNGEVQMPTVTVKAINGNTMTQDKSYTVAYSGESKKPGTYTVTVKGTGYYYGTVTKTYKIDQQPVTAENVTLSEDNFIYNGAVQQPAVTVRAANGSVMTLNTSYTVAWSAASKAPGTYTVTVTGKGNFKGAVTKEYTITEQPLDAARVTLSATRFTYNGEVQIPTVTVKAANGGTMTQDKSYTVSCSGGSKKPGTYTLTIKGKGYYKGTVKKTYKIDQQPVTADNVTLSADSFIYNGAVQQPAVTVRAANGSVMTLNTSYTVAWSAASKAPGTYTVTVTGKGNFKGAVTKEYTITEQPLDAARVTLSATRFTYNGEVQIPTVTVKAANGGTMTQDKSYTVSYSADSKIPGTYTVTVTGKGYYKDSVTKEYIIDQQPIDASRVTLSADSFTYNGKVQKPTVTVRSAGGGTLTQGSSYTVAYSAGCKEPGSYYVIIIGTGRYTGTVTKTFTINER